MKRCLGGHPYLVNRGLHAMTALGLTVAALEAEASREQGLFFDHLHRVGMALAMDPELTGLVRKILQSPSDLDRVAFGRLSYAGLMVGDHPQTARWRCELYARYLQAHLA